MKKFPSIILIFILFFFSAKIIFAGNNYFWKPAGASRSFNTAGNWRVGSCGGSVATSIPGKTDTIVFSSCNNNECHINGNDTVASISMQSNYTDTLFQDNGYTFTFEHGSFKGGVFMGGNSAIRCLHDMAIDGTAFKSTSNVLTVKGDFTYKTGGFTHNNGQVVFNKGATANTVISSTSNSVAVSFYKVEFGAPIHNTSFNVKNIDMQVNNEFKLSGDSSIMLSSTTSSVIKAKGDVLSSNTCTTGGGTATIEINGTGSQTWSDTYGTDESGKFPNVKINKSGGTLSLSGSIAIGGSAELNYVAAGSLSAGTSSLIFYYNNTIRNNSGGSMNLYNLEIMGNGGKDSVKGTITVTHNFTTSQSGNCVILSTNGGSGLLEIQGDVAWNNSATSSFGSIPFKMTGGNAQTFSGSIEPIFYNLEINKSGGQLTLQKSLTISNNLNLVAKNIITTSTNLLTLKNGATVSNASASSFVSGPVKKIGNSSFTFPLGAGSSYKPLAITAPSSTTDAFTAEYFGAIQPFGLNRSGLTYVSSCEYWNLTRTTGSSTVKITLSWDSHSCDIYTLSTLKIGRWDVIGPVQSWIDVGTVTTTGNTTSGTIQTSSNQSYFGYFAIAKNSPAVMAHAGTDVTISLGGSASLGASPTATGGTSPYTYQWYGNYALSSSTSANPVATPFQSYQYYLKVTDADKMIDFDTVNVTVNGFDLKTANRFALLAGGSITVDSDPAVCVTGAVGSGSSITGIINATDSVLVSTSVVTKAVNQLDTAIKAIDALSSHAILGSDLSGHTYNYSAIFRITGNAALNGTLTLTGNASSFFIFDIDRNFTIAANSHITLME